MNRPAKPFTVIGGFLGAGKTTLLNRILAEASGIRFAVLVNDFGAINIDQALVKSHDGKTLSLSNGCICCSLADGFITTMIGLMQRADSFDHIVVEASGVSHPQRIMDMALLDPELLPDAIIVLIDSQNFEKSAADPSINSVVGAQVESADLLVLNKQDLVDGQRLAALETHLGSRNENAPRLITSMSRLPLELVIGINANRHHKPALATALQTDTHSPFHALTLKSRHDIDRDEFLSATHALDASILRAKGFLVFSDSASKYWLWQAVGDRSTLHEADAMTYSSAVGNATVGQQCVVVLIGTCRAALLENSLVSLFDDAQMSEV